LDLRLNAFTKGNQVGHFEGKKEDSGTRISVMDEEEMNGE
jgi:hypothetical protein